MGRLRTTLLDRSAQLRDRAAGSLSRLTDAARVLLLGGRVRLIAVAASLAVVAALVLPPAAPRRFLPRAAAASDGLFVGSTEPGRAGAERSALALVTHLGGLPIAAAEWRDWLADPGAVAADRCPTSRLEVQWTPPTGHYDIGGYVEPLGPPPTAATRQVNGIVVCRGSSHAYTGFEASWDGVHWLLDSVPAVAAETERPLLATDVAPPQPAAAPAVPVADGGLPDPSQWRGTPIEPLADYVFQQTCDPTPKPGVLGFRDLLLAAEPGSRNLGIGRECDTPDGISEHKEGRAFDWGVNADNPGEVAMANTVLSWLFAPDADGNPYAMARRLGVMYIIWDRHIWGSYRAADGWRPYSGVSEHRDHIHFSFSWDGALGRTSFWQGALSDRLRRALAEVPAAAFAAPPVPPGGLPGGLAALVGPGAALAPAPAANPVEAAPPAQDQPSPSTTTTTSPPPSTTTTTTEPVATTTTTFQPAPAPIAPTTTTTITLPPLGGDSTSGSGGGLVP